MKKTGTFLLLIAFLLCSCEKEDLVPEGEWPQWLKQNIEMHEQSIKENPKAMAGMAAWNRTTWNQQYYYEYFNPLLSSLPHPISHSGDTLDVFVGYSDSDYHKEKCCIIYVWKGPDYIRIFD